MEDKFLVRQWKNENIYENLTRINLQYFLPLFILMRPIRKFLNFLSFVQLPHFSLMIDTAVAMMGMFTNEVS